MKKRPEGVGEAVKYMGHGIVVNVSKSAMLPGASNESDVLSRHCKKLFQQLNVCLYDIYNCVDQGR